MTIEFHRSDDAIVSLMEMRFFVPTDPDSTVDPVKVIHPYIVKYITQSFGNA